MERTPEGVIDFSQFKQKKEQEDIQPFFTKPTVITLGDGEQEIEYYLLINLIYNGKQILAMERASNKEEGVSVVEAVIEDNKFVGVQAISTDEEYDEIVEILSDTFAKMADNEPTGDDNNVEH